MEARILIAGSEGSGKHAIASTIKDMGESLNLKIHTCVEIEGHTTAKFICLMVQMNSQSMKIMTDNASVLNMPQILEKCVVLVNTRGVKDLEGLYQKMMTQFKEKYGVPVLFCNTEVEMERIDVCRRMIRMTQASVGRRRVVSPMVYDAVGASLLRDRTPHTVNT